MPNFSIPLSGLTAASFSELLSSPTHAPLAV